MDIYINRHMHKLTYIQTSEQNFLILITIKEEFIFPILGITSYVDNYWLHTLVYIDC